MLSAGMTKIVIDTKVLVAALIQRNYPYYLLQTALTDKNIAICLSKAVFGECLNVLKRQKFAKYQDFQMNAYNLLLDIEQIGKHYQPTHQQDMIKDRGDNKFLDLAEACLADYLITGNANDFTFDRFKGTLIVTPKTFWESWYSR